jgi:tRNA pseudouridine38-40 synthase
MTAQRWKITIEYDGTDFCGWQRQDNAFSVQECIEKSIHAFCGETVTLHAAGRTDAGVHATGQVAHFDVERAADAKTIRDAINFHARPHAVAVVRAEAVSADFHARFSAKQRQYRYTILMSRGAPPVLQARHVWHVWQNLDIAAMNAGAAHLLGEHDFTSFRAAECQAKSPVKSIDRLEWIVNETHHGDGTLITLHAEARSFLHHQVRNIAGTLKMVGEGKLTEDDVKKILNARDRTKAGVMAPAAGLCFIGVNY